MLACTSKNDRASMLFAELRKLCPDILDLGVVRASRLAKIKGALSSLTTDLKQLRTDMEFSAAVAQDMQWQTEAKVHRNPGISHVLQWGAMYAPVNAGDGHPYSIITDGPYDPEDTSYPVEWRPLRWSASYFSRQHDIYARAEHVFSLSAWARNKLLKIHLLDPDKVVPIGWGPLFTVPEPNLTSSPSNYFVSIGNQWHRKGMDIVAEAGYRIHLRFPNIQTVLAGEPHGVTLPPLEGVSQICHSLGRQMVKDLIGNARALIVASRFDASPHIIMEALQLGTPVIGTDVCGIPEGISPPSGGCVVPSGDIAALTDAMVEIVAADPHRQRVDARNTYTKSGGWEKSARILRETLKI